MSILPALTLPAHPIEGKRLSFKNAGVISIFMDENSGRILTFPPIRSLYRLP